MARPKKKFGPKASNAMKRKDPVKDMVKRRDAQRREAKKKKQKELEQQKLEADNTLKTQDGEAIGSAQEETAMETVETEETEDIEETVEKAIESDPEIPVDDNAAIKSEVSRGPGVV